MYFSCYVEDPNASEPKRYDLTASTAEQALIELTQDLNFKRDLPNGIYHVSVYEYAKKKPILENAKLEIKQQTLSSLNKEFKFSFVLTIDSINSIVKQLEPQFGTLTIKAGCADDIDREFISVQDLARYENGRAKAITELSFEGQSRYRYISIKFPTSLFHSVALSIRAPDSEIIQIKESIGEILEGSLPWYHKIRVFNTYPMFMVYLFIIYIGVFSIIPKKESNIIIPYYLGFLFVVLFIVLVLGLPYLFHKLWSYLFPKGVFLIGQGVNRHDILEKFRWATVISLAIGILGSMIAAYFFKWLGN